MATSNRELIELLRGLLYDRGPQANGEIAAKAARAVAEHDIDAAGSTVVTLSRHELNAVLAGLRLLQGMPFSHLPLGVQNVYTEDGDTLPLDEDGIDNLCERLNGGEG